MYISRHYIAFPVLARKNSQGECPITVRITYSNQWRFNEGEARGVASDSEEHQVITHVSTGYKVSPNKWIKDSQSVKPNTSNKDKISASTINGKVTSIEVTCDNVFKAFEVKGVMPTQKEFSEAVSKALGRTKARPKESLTVWEAYNRFIVDESRAKCWEPATLAKHNSLKRLLSDYDSELQISQFDAQKVGGYADFMLERDMKNTSVKRNISFLKTFLRWCEAKGMVKTNWESYKTELKTIHRAQVVFLTLDEVKKLYSFEFPPEKAYLSRCRDVFVFQCFTGLRYSDVAKLKKSDVGENSIRVVTEKTDTALNIELNKYSRAILDKYKDVDLSNDLALPVTSNQRENDYIKEVCAICGIDSPVSKVFYKGGKKVEETKPKYELVGTHTGRRSFICNALSMGISAEVVMRWTGHSDYKAMLPYIDVADNIKKEKMALFDNI
jgi:site-specific recombinase XerD